MKMNKQINNNNKKPHLEDSKKTIHYFENHRIKGIKHSSALPI
jgi:hypothetical protein